MRAGLLAVLLTFALILLGAAFCLHQPNTLKPLAALLTEWLLDRSLAIDGDLTLTLSLQPRISGTGVRLGNAPDARSAYMATAEYALFQIDLASLFNRHVHLLDLDVRGAVINLEDPVDGRPNWLFFDEVKDEPDWTFMIEGLNVARSRINAYIGELEPIELSMSELNESSDQDGNLHLDGTGLLNDYPWTVSGMIGPFEELLIAGQLDLDLNLMIDDSNISASGHIAHLASLSELDLDLTVSGPDADVFGEIFRMPEAFAGDVALKARIQPEDGGHALSIRGHISDFEITTAGTVSDLNNLNGWDGSIVIRGPEAGVFGKALQIKGFPEGAFLVQGTLHLFGGDLDVKDMLIRTEDAELILNADFEDFPRREGAFGTFRLSGSDISNFSTLLGLPALPTEPFELEVTLDAGVAEVLNSSFKIGSHTLTVAGPVGEFPEYHGTRLKVGLKGNDIAMVLSAAGVDQPLTGPYQAGTNLSFDASGLTLSDLEVLMTEQKLRGTLRWPEFSELDRFELDLSLELANLAEIAALFEVKGLPAQPLTAEAALRGHDGELTISSSNIRSNGLVLDLSGNLSKLTGTTGVDLNLDLTGPSVDTLFNDALPNDGRRVPFNLHAGIQVRGDTLQLNGFELRTEGGNLNADGTIALNGDFAGSTLIVSGQGNNLAELIPDFPSYSAPEKPWQIRAELTRTTPDQHSIREGRLTIGSVEIILSGKLDTDDHSHTLLTFDATGDRITDIGQIGNVPWPLDAFSISAELAGSRNAIEIRRLKADWGRSDLEGSGTVDLAGKPTVVLKGTSEVLDVIDLQHALFGEPEDIDQSDDATTFFSDKPIPIGYLDAFDADVDVQVGVFRGQRATIEDIALALNVREGGLELERAAFRDEVGYFDARGIIRPVEDGIRMEIIYLGEDMDLGLFVAPDQPREGVPRYSMNVDVSGRGLTVAEVAGSLNGTVLISSDGGQISNELLNAFAGDFLSNVLEVLNPFSTTEDITDMKCLVINAGIQDGKVKLEPGIVMRTDRLNMFVFGGINLKTETLDLSLATQARRGIGISAASITNPYFKIGGTLTSPALALDPASATVAASVATATAGLSILIKGIWDRLMGTRNPCPHFLEFQQDRPRDGVHHPRPIRD